MAKKNPYIFTIGFNPKDPDHIQVANRLNEMGKGSISAFLVRAVLAYEDSATGSLDPQIMESLVQRIVAEQLATRRKSIEMLSSSTPDPNVSLLDDFAQKNILNGVSGFRKK